MVSLAQINFCESSLQLWPFLMLTNITKKKKEVVIYLLIGKSHLVLTFYFVKFLILLPIGIRQHWKNKSVTNRIHGKVWGNNISKQNMRKEYGSN